MSARTAAEEQITLLKEGSNRSRGSWPHFRVLFIVQPQEQRIMTGEARCSATSLHGRGKPASGRAGKGSGRVLLTPRTRQVVVQRRQDGIMHDCAECRLLVSGAALQV